MRLTRKAPHSPQIAQRWGALLLGSSRFRVSDAQVLYPALPAPQRSLEFQGKQKSEIVLRAA